MSEAETIKSKSQRSLHYDVLRIIACLGVITMHAPIPHAGWSRMFLSSLSYFCAPSIGLFFMISGALLLNKHYLNGFDTKEFLRKRFTRILWPIIIWTAIGHILTYCGIRNTEIGILWFMYAISGLYLLTPILYRWLHNADRQEIEFYLILWVISLIYPLIKHWVDLKEGPSSWIYYFHGYAGYFILGYYLANFSIRRLWAISFIVSFILFSLFLPSFSFLYGLKFDFYSCFWYLSISVALQCVFWWFIIKRIADSFEPLRKIIETVSKHSFGIYLIHVLFLRNFLWKLDWIQSLSGPVQVLTCVFLTFVLSLMLSIIISKLKFGKYIVGV